MTDDDLTRIAQENKDRLIRLEARLEANARTLDRIEKEVNND